MNKNPKKKTKKVIKWENVLLIPILILAVNGIIKSNPNFITLSIVQHIIITFIYYYAIKEIRSLIQKKGLLKTIREFISLK